MVSPIKSLVGVRRPPASIIINDFPPGIIKVFLILILIMTPGGKPFLGYPKCSSRICSHIAMNEKINRLTRAIGVNDVTWEQK